jgi:transporter family protein
MLYLYLILSIIFWGSAPIFDKVAVKSVDVYSGIFFRSLAITVIFGILHLIYRSSEIIFVNSFRGVIFYIISGILAGGFGAMFYFNALKLGDASFVVPVAATYPLITAILSIIFLNEQITFSRVVGIIFIILGIWFIK